VERLHEERDEARAAVEALQATVEAERQQSMVAVEEVGVCGMGMQRMPSVLPPVASASAGTGSLPMPAYPFDCTRALLVRLLKRGGPLGPACCPATRRGSGGWCRAVT